MRRFLIAIVSLAILPALLQAQRGGMAGGAGGGHAFAAPAPHAAMHTAPSATTRTTSASHPNSSVHYYRTRSGAIVARTTRPAGATSVRNTGSTRRILSEDDIPVPGLGFDYTHFAATHPGYYGRNRNSQFVGAYFPFFGGGYYTPLYSDDEEAPPADAQQAENGEPSPPPYPGPPPYDNAQQNYPAQTYEPAPVSAAQRESEEYVFVRRDGTVFFAVAYAWENGSLRYVTDEGLRHVLTADKLDLDATKQFNEQRGLDFRAPVPTA